MFIRALTTLACLVPALAAGATYVDDPLTGGYNGRGARGGSFGANGWTTTAGEDAIWYVIPDALVEGRIEYSVTGIDTSPTGNFFGNDHDLLCVYNGTAAEPIPYTPYFRENDFKVFTRLFGVNEGAPRTGALKIEIAVCPRGDPWYNTTACPMNCGTSANLYANNVDRDIGWNPAATYRMAMWWGNGQFGFSRDGTLLATHTFTGTFAPQPLVVRIGSPRHGPATVGATQFMPVGLVFKDLLVTGTPGTRTPACGQEPIDAGNPEPDAGVIGPQTPVELSVLADVTAASYETGVFPDALDLGVEGGATPTSIVYLRFPTFSGNVSRALLRLHTRTVASSGGSSGHVCAVADNTWGETTLTWATRPAFGTCVGLSRAVADNEDVEWDITSLYAGGPPLSLAIVPTAPDGVHYVSRESGLAAQAPRLIVTTSNAPADAGMNGGGAGGGSAGGHAGAGGGGGAAGGAGPSAGGGRPPDLTATGTCGCSSHAAAQHLAALLLVLLVLRRRATP